MRKTVEVPAYHEMMQELFQAIKELGGSGTIQEIDDKIKRGDNSLNIKEGGAGIYKIYDLLCSLPQRFNVNHCIQNNEFILNIEIKK